MAAISAQNATLTLDGVPIDDVISYEIGVALYDQEVGYGAVRVQTLSNTALAVRSNTYRRRKLIITHANNARVFEAWVFARNVRVLATRNDIVRYTFEFTILSVPLFS